MITIGSYSYEEYLQVVESFHGAVAPGLIIGGFVVDRATNEMPEGVLLDAICETLTCLPDAVQLLTPCTVGNGWLRVFNLGRFALSLHEKYDGRGIRVYLDATKLEPWPEIRNWFLKLKLKAEQDRDLLLAQIKEARHEICGVRRIQVQPQLLGKRSSGRVKACTCPKCPFGG